MGIKRFIYDRIAALPASLLLPLMRLNKKPERLFGSGVARYFKKLQENSFTAEQCEKQLLEMVNYAILNIPFYKERYQQIDTIDDFRKQIGFIDKDTVVAKLEKFLAKPELLKDYEMQTTGGTSGKPLQIYQPKNRYALELATVYQAWSMVGYNFDIRGVMRNHHLKNGRDFEMNPVTREIRFNNFNVQEDYLTRVYHILRKYKVRYFHAYPSAAYQFAVHCKKNGLDIRFLKAFLCSSENILPIQRELIEKEMGIKLMAFYGHTEKLVFAANCPVSSLYHVEPSYGFFELIGDDGQAVKTPGESGEICGTTFYNYGMPLIRYKTGDFATYAGEVCPHCGARKTVLSNIMGRWHGDRIENPDGTTVTLTALNLHGDIYTHIEGLQYYHPERGVLEAFIIPAATFNAKHEKQLMDDLRSKFNQNMRISIHKVQNLQHHKNGKFLQLIRSLE